MLFTTVLLGTIALGSTPSSEPATLLVTDLAHSESVAPDIAQTLSDLVTAECSRDTGFRVMSGTDVRNLIALEGEKQAVGCEDEANCLAEVAGSLGARFVIFGRVSTLDALYVLHLNLMDATTGIAIAREVEQGDSVSHFTKVLGGASKRLLAKAHEILMSEEAARRSAAGEPGVTNADSAPSMEPSLVPMGLMLGGAGVLVAGALAGALAIAFIGYQLPRVLDTSTDVSERQGAQMMLQAGVGLGLLGAVVATAGLGVTGVGIFLE